MATLTFNELKANLIKLKHHYNTRIGDPSLRTEYILILSSLPFPSPVQILQNTGKPCNEWENWHEIGKKEDKRDFVF